jgi:hypothetical protein
VTSIQHQFTRKLLLLRCAGLVADHADGYKRGSHSQPLAA